MTMDDAPIDDEGEIISEFIDVDPFEDERQARLWLMWKTAGSRARFRTLGRPRRPTAAPPARPDEGIRPSAH